MSATNTRRQGGIAALLAMRKLVKITEHDYDDTAEAFRRNQAEAIRAVTDAAGPLSPFQLGFIEALAEAFYFTVTTGAPDLQVWKPDAAMTGAELKAWQQNLDAMYAECAA